MLCFYVLLSFLSPSYRPTLASSSLLASFPGLTWLQFFDWLQAIKSGARKMKVWERGYITLACIGGGYPHHSRRGIVSASMLVFRYCCPSVFWNRTWGPPIIDLGAYHFEEPLHFSVCVSIFMWACVPVCLDVGVSYLLFSSRGYFFLTTNDSFCSFRSIESLLHRARS